MRPELRAWADAAIGRTERFSIGAIDRLWAQRYAVAVDDLNPLYFDEAHARRHGHAGLVVPPNYLATLRGAPNAGPAEDGLLPDGMDPSARPPLPGLIGMGGGQSLVFHRFVCCGEQVDVERSVVSVEEKQGRSGPLVIIQQELRYLTGAARPLLTLRNTLLCRWIGEAAS
jgi:acyl dehydratase